MNLANFLSIIGIVIGLPSFVYLICGGFYAYGIFAGLLVALLCYYVWDTEFRGNYHIISSEKVVEIHDQLGHAATVTKNLTIRANYRGLSEYVHRNISADGKILTFDTNFGRPEVKRDAGDYVVFQRFPHPLKKWEKISLKLVTKHEDSFTLATEGTILIIDYKTKSASIKIFLPEERPCKGARVLYRSGSDERNLGQPEVSANYREIKWIGKGLRVGCEYEIEWDW